GAWTNAAGYASALTGNGTNLPGLPFLTKDSVTAVSVVSGGVVARTFDGTTERFFLKETLSQNSGANEYTLTDTAGNVLVFNDFNVSPTGKRGQLKSFTDPAGNVTTVTAYTSSGSP